jgi:hypothetical protein
VRRNPFRHALARWGFTALALVSYAGGFPQGAIVAGALAFYAWKNR